MWRGRFRLWWLNRNAPKISVLKSLESIWRKAYLDPASIQDPAFGILANGDDGLVDGLTVGPGYGWYYPETPPDPGP